MKGSRLLVAAATGLALLGSTTACAGGENSEYEQVCMDESTGQRADDSKCPADYNSPMLYPGFYPYFYPIYYPVPAVGQPIPSDARGYRYDKLPATAKVNPAKPPKTGGAVNPSAPKPKNTWNQPPKANGGVGSNGKPTKQDPPKAPAPKSNTGTGTGTGSGSGNAPKQPQGSAPKAPAAPPRVAPPAPRPAPPAAPPRSR